MDDLESLYPSLYGNPADDGALLRQLVFSTAEKAQAISQLRDRLAPSSAPGLAACAQAMAERFDRGGRLFTMGNGGSATDAEALARVFSCPPRGRARPAICLTADVAVVTALSNDVGFGVVFSRQLAAQASANDVVVGLSTSGNSENLLQAFEQARRLGLLTVGLAGGRGGKMAEADSIDHLFVVPSDSIHRIQEAQTTLYHVLWEVTQVASAMA